MQSNKHRDMARSILPSKARSIPADLAAVKRHHRRAVRADLRALRLDHHDDTAVDLTRTADREINQIRSFRRSADKLNHFERWAVEVTKHMPVEDRLGWLRSVLPGGLIGGHAMSHLRRIPELQPHVEWRWWRTWDEVQAERRAEQQRLRDRLTARLLRALEIGGHREINLALRSTEGADDPPGRRLHGLHDVDDLVAALMGDGAKRHAVEKVLAEISERRDSAAVRRDEEVAT